MSEKQSIKLKKAAEGEVHGPMEMKELMELSQAAFVAPEDEVSLDDGDWKPAHEIPELGMDWIIRTGEGIEYGPTSQGTIREFLMVGEISEENTLYHKTSEEEKTVGHLLGDSVVEEAKEEQRQASKVIEDPAQEEPELEKSLEVAKDIRIHQLETDLHELENKYNSLTLKFRKVSEELTTLKQK
ncbi:MAG: hypothetical protein AAF649_06455 [Verrucomicrobiota bacterium]